MSRRRMLVVSSSDEEDEPQQRNQNHPHQFGIGLQQLEDQDQEDEIEVEYEDHLPDIDGVALGSSNPIQPQLLSDDDVVFIDVPDHFSPPPIQNSAIPSSNGGCPVREVLRGLGLNLRDQWLESCIRGLETAVPGFSGLDSGTKAKFCFEQFLNSDMNFSGGGVLPPIVASMHLVELAGPFVLQVDEIVNIGSALRERYQNAAAGPKRCLKLSMTDGFQRVFGMEYRPIKDLQVLAQAGFKVAIKNVVVRRGLLMLVPEVLEILGGSVQELEAARQRLVIEVNKPARGKRTRQGVLPPLATRATQAAWSQNGATNPAQNNTSAQQSNNSGATNPAQHNTSIPQSNNSGATNPAQNNTSAQQSNNSGATNPAQHNTFVQQSNNSGATNPAQNNNSAQQSNNSGATNPAQNNTSAQQSNNSTHQDMQGSAPSLATRSAYNGATNPVQNNSSAQQSNNSSRRDVQGSTPSLASRATLDAWLQSGATNSAQNNTSAQQFNNSSRQNVQGSAPPGPGINIPRTTVDSVIEIPSSPEIDEFLPTRDTTDHPSTRESIVLSPSVMDVEDNFGSTVQDVEMADPTNQLYTLTGDRELPFTYLSCLSAKWVSVKGKESQVRGKIKCFLTSVLGFKYKERDTYELRVFVEDGSLIHDVLVHHNAVQKAIGYSPEEVKVALSSSDSETVAGMKNVLGNFQKFLLNFEGYLLIEHNESSDLPIAIEMNQGCLASDACSLLNRFLTADYRSAFII